MPGINVRRGGETTTRFVHTAPSVTRPRWSALLHQGRHACPDAKRAGLSHIDRTDVGARLIMVETETVDGPLRRGQLKWREAHDATP
jgi:hypothetical protein